MKYRRSVHALPGPEKLGQIGRNHDSTDWFLVTKVGSRGGTSGPCIYGHNAKVTGNFSQLRSRAVYVPDNEVPSEVTTALAARVMLGRRS